MLIRDCIPRRRIVEVLNVVIVVNIANVVFVGAELLTSLTSL